MKIITYKNGTLVCAIMLILFAGCTAQTPTTTTTIPTTEVTTTTTTTTTTTSTTRTTSTTTTTIQPGLMEIQSDLGVILTGNQGMTLYIFKNDALGVSNCNGQCAVTWPPLIATGTPNSPSDVSSQITTITRSDGSSQVALRGMPLYYYSGDSNAGDINGEGIGGVWSAARIAVTTTTTRMVTTTTYYYSGGYGY